MLIHFVNFLYFFGIIFGMVGLFLICLIPKKNIDIKVQYQLLQKFMTSTFLIGLISFFIFYRHYMILHQPTYTTFEMTDYLLWACFVFYWLDYLDAIVYGPILRQFKKIIRYGCLCYIVIWLVTSYVWVSNLDLLSRSSRMLFTLYGIIFSITLLFVVVLYVYQCQSQVQNRLTRFHILSVSVALTTYTVFQILHYMKQFSVLSAPDSWILQSVFATSCLILFTNLMTLIYIYYHNLLAYFCTAHSEVFSGKNFLLDASPEIMIENIAAEYNITPREKEIMEFVYKGLNNIEIANKLFISQNTVKHHIYNLFRKLKVHNRIELICLLQDTDPKI